MRFATITTLAIAAVGTSAAVEFCPAADSLFYYGGNGNQYQVKCGVEYFTSTNLKSVQTSNPILCAAACESWTKSNPSKPCAAGSWDVNNSLCFLKPGDLNANKRKNAGVITTFKI